MRDIQLLITGGPGSGASTTGRMISKVLEIPCFDSDDYFHRPTDPPYQEQYSKEERRLLLHEKISSSGSWILSGSISAWGITDIVFSHAVLLNIDTPIRIQRLKLRELERFGSRICEGGDLYDEHIGFLGWASCYETGELEGRSLPMERNFIKSNCTHLLEIERELSLEVLTKSIMVFLDGK
ncbi:MAG: adenylate kinase [Pseudomonadales bacterium]|nr:adenylate kinase [Pseudomonadales bacterium]